MNFKAKNLEALAENNPSLSKRVQEYKCQSIGELVLAESGDATAKLLSPGSPPVWAYNAQNPWNDAAVHLKTVPEKDRSLVVFVGMGLGYGPLLVQRERQNFAKMVIFEPCLDVFCLALEAVDLTPLICSDRVSFFVEEVDYELVEKDVSRNAATLDTHILRHVPSFAWRREVYASADEKVFMLFNQLNTRGGTTSQHGADFFTNRLENLSLIRHSNGLESLANKFDKKPAVLVAAGPSLNESLPLLKKVEGRCVLIAADSALSPLLNAGINPDFVTTIDFQDLTLEKLIPCLNQKLDLALVSMIKASPIIAKRFPARQVFFAFPEDLPHGWIMKALGVKSVIPAPAAVPHLSLGLAIVLGADPIVFVGQDLAYTSKVSDHAAGTILAGSGTPIDRELFNVPAVNGGHVSTDKGFLAQKKQFEDTLREYPRTYLNATAAGVSIEGTEHMALEEVVKHHLSEEINVKEIIDVKAGSADMWNAEKFVMACKANLRQISKAFTLLQKNRKLEKEIKRRFKKISTPASHISKIADLPKELARLITQYDKNHQQQDKLDVIGKHILELTFQDLNENDTRAEENTKLLKKEGYLPWLKAEISRLAYVNKVRLEASYSYRDNLQKIVGYLEKEKKILVKVKSQHSPENLLEMAGCYCDVEQYQLARPCLEEVVELTADNVEAHILLGKVHAELLDFVKARKCWQSALNLDIGKAEQIKDIRQNLVAELIDNIVRPGMVISGLLTGWISKFAMLFGEDDDWPCEALLNLWEQEREEVEKEISQGNIPAAVKKITPWDGLADFIPEYSYLLSRCWWHNGEGDMAWQLCEKALTLDTENATWLAWSARIALESGRFDDGIARLKKAAGIDPETAVLWEELGDFLHETKDFVSAISSYEQCFLSLPDRTDLLRKIGDCHLANNQPRAAVSAFEAFLDKMPDNTEVPGILEKIRQIG